jgi:cyclase
MHFRNVLSFRFTAVAGLMAFATAAFAQAPAAAPFTAHQLKPNVYWIEGGGGNSGVIIGDKGVIVVDAKTTPAGGKELLENIAKITPKPVTTVILTHSDGDHVNGLASFPEGITIIAHENNKKEQEKALAAGGRGAPPEGHLPTQVVTKKMEKLKLDGVQFELLHWAPAHTSGDLVLYLPDSKIAFLGDLGGAGIHLENNGSSEGMIETIRGLLALDADTYVRGHGGALATKADLQKGLDDLVERRSKIVGLYSAGKSLDEAEQAMGEKPKPRAKAMLPGLNTFRAARDMNFTEIVYTEMSRR